VNGVIGAACWKCRPAQPPPVPRQLAWDLWNGISQFLKRSERHQVAMVLAAREFFDAIMFLLVAVVHTNTAIPSDVADRLRRWSHTYGGHPGHAAIRSLVERAVGSRGG